jgi:hypothetical protein
MYWTSGECSIWHILLTHLVLDTLDPGPSSSTPAPMITSSNTLLQSDNAAVLYGWTIKLDGELMWLIVASCAVAVAGERRHWPSLA